MTPTPYGAGDDNGIKDFSIDFQHFESYGITHPTPPEVESDKAETKKNDLEPFFNPRIVAVVGASPKRGKVGNVILRNIMDAKNIKQVYPVNPKYNTIEGLKCYRCVSEIPNEIDLAVISLKAPFVPEIVEKCVRVGVRGIVVISSGFSEMGGREGQELERKIYNILKQGSTRLLGPNTLGYFIPSTNLDLVFLEKETFKRPKKGGIAIVSQSGSLGVDFMDELSCVGSGISMFIGLGNKIDINECDLMKYLEEDNNTKCVALYLESITDGDRFFRMCKSVSNKKPVVMLKGGKSKSGSKATSLHTGKMGGEYRVLKGIMDQVGIIEARNEIELIDYARAMAELPSPHGNRVLIITNGGGNAIVAVDLLEENWNDYVKLAPINSDFKEHLRKSLPDFISASNPIDLTVSAGNTEYINVLKLAARYKVCDIVIVGITSKEGLDDSLVIGIKEVSKRYSMPVVVYLKGSSIRERLMKKFGFVNIPAYPSTGRAINAAGAFMKWYALKRIKRDWQV